MNKEGNLSNSNESDTQRQRQEKQIVRRSSKSSEQIGRTVRLDISQEVKQNPQCS